MHEMPPEYQDVIPTSVQALSPNSIGIKILSELPIDNDRKYHSIIGIRDAQNGPGSSDGIVPYSSSHLDGASSEYLVHDSHTCVSNACTITEVKRLVLLHLKEIDDQNAAAKEKESAKPVPDDFSKIPIPVLRDQLKAVKDAWESGNKEKKLGCGKSSVASRRSLARIKGKVISYQRLTAKGAVLSIRNC